MNQGSGAANSLLNGIGRVAGAMGVAFGIKSILNLSDTMTSTTARLNLMNDGLQTTAELQDMIYQSAQNSRTAYTDTAQVVAKLGMLAGDSFASNEETVAFAEQMNKQFKIGGASVQEQTSAMYQLTQAMAAGKLQGDEFRSIMENAPMLANSIADYMGIPKGELKEMASDGVITADIIKNAMFAAADETNAQFEKLPMTFAQVGTVIGNTLLQTFDPIIQGIGQGAQWIYDNWSYIEPVFYGVAAGVTAYAVAMGISNAVTWLGVEANKALLLTMLKNPWMWVAVGIGIAVGAVYKWVQSVGGISIAWMIAKDKVMTALDQMGIGIYAAGVAMGDFFGGIRADALSDLQIMVNGGIDMINEFINAINKIPGVAFDTIEHVTFGTTAQIEYEAAKNARAANLKNMKYDAGMNHTMRQMQIDIARENAAAQADNGIDYSIIYGNVADIAANTGDMKDSMEISEEELKYIRDMAEREVINRFTTAEVKVEMTNHNNINSDMDIDGVIDMFGEKLEDSIISIAEGVHE
jgi:tape measure domain-containing protein